MDAWSDGQVSSKLWLCRSIESFLKERPRLTLWIFGSWYGTLAFLLLTRERLDIKKIYCFDVDRRANKIAKKILDHWRFQEVEIEVFNEDCQNISIDSPYYKMAKPDLIINTSCEHMSDYQWWQHIPPETFFALQSTDMPHPTHINPVHSLNEFRTKISPCEIFRAEEKHFSYPTLKFNRFMLVGKKGSYDSCQEPI